MQYWLFWLYLLPPLVCHLNHPGLHEVYDQGAQQKPQQEVHYHKKQIYANIPVQAYDQSVLSLAESYWH